MENDLPKVFVQSAVNILHSSSPFFPFKKYLLWVKCVFDCFSIELEEVPPLVPIFCFSYFEDRQDFMTRWENTQI